MDKKKNNYSEHSKYTCFGCKLQRKYPMLLYNWVLNYKKCDDVDLLKIGMSIKMNDKIYKYHHL
jgi:hypothetical protein